MSILIFLAAVAATAEPPAVVVSGAEAMKAVNEAKADRKICKVERFVGSHLSKRTCMTKMEWEGGKQNAKDALNHLNMINIAERNEGGDAMPPSPAQKGMPPR